MSAEHSRLTPRARRVLAHAVDEALGLHHHYVGTEHLLLGIAREQDGLGAVALTALEVTNERLRDAVTYVIGPGPGPTTDTPELVPRARRALDLAAEESNRLKHNYIGTEHLLIGLLLEDEGVAAGILAGLGVTVDAARAQIDALVRAAARDAGAKVTVALALRERQTRGGTDASTTRGNVITVRVTNDDLAAIDALVESGIRSTRSDAAAWLIGAGIVANDELLDKLNATIEQIRQRRASAQALVQG